MLYVSTARHSLPKDHIIKAVVAFYDPIVVKAAKRVLYELCKKVPTDRRRAAKTILDAQDIYELLNSADAENIEIPKFVANSFQAMPPASEFNELSNVIISFMERIEQLDKEIKKSKERMQLDVKSFEECLTIRQELVDIKQNTMMLLESAPKSGEAVLTNVNTLNNGTDTPIPENNAATRSYSNALTGPTPQRNIPHTNKQVQPSRNAPHNTNNINPGQHTNNQTTVNNTQTPPPTRDIPSPTGTELPNKNRQSRGSFGTGRTGPLYNFRGAPKLVDIYVGKCIK